MSQPRTGTTATPIPRWAYLAGLVIAVAGAILLSTKAIVAKLLYRYHIDAVTLIAFRMLFSFPVFAALVLWKMRTEAPLAAADRWRSAGLGAASTGCAWWLMRVSGVAGIVAFFVLRPAALLVQPLPVHGLSLVNAVFCTIFPYS